MELIILIWGFWIVPSNVPKCPTTKQYGSTPALIPDKEWPDYTLFGTGKSLYTRPPNTVTLFLLSPSTVSPLFRVKFSSTLHRVKNYQNYCTLNISKDFTFWIRYADGNSFSRPPLPLDTIFLLSTRDCSSIFPFGQFTFTDYPLKSWEPFEISIVLPTTIAAALVIRGMSNVSVHFISS